MLKVHTNRPSRPVGLAVRTERATPHPQSRESMTATALRAREESLPVGVEPLD